MKPAPFGYHAPRSVAETVEMLARFGDEGKVLAGGQSLVPVLAMRLSRFDHLVDLGHVEGLAGVSRTNGTVRIGAMTTQAAVARSAEVRDSLPLLARATGLIGHFQIRNRGTLGGSLAHADPAAEYPAVAAALDAELEAVGPNGARRIQASDFFHSTWTTALEPEEVLVAARFPVWSGRCGFAVEEAARRHGDFAMAGVVCAVELDGERVRRVAIASFGMASTPVRASAAEAVLAGAAVADVDADDLAGLAVEGLDPPEDLHASGTQRLRMGRALVARAVTRAIDEAVGEARHG